MDKKHKFSIIGISIIIVILLISFFPRTIVLANEDYYFAEATIFLVTGKIFKAF